MNLIQEILAYYRMGFGRILDFSSPSSRKEINYFVLSYFVFWVILCVISIVCTSLLSVFVNNIPKLFLYEGILLVGYNLIHILPLLTLMRRRLNDIIPQKAKLIFSGIVLCYLIQISGPVIIFTQKTALVNNPEKFLIFIPYIIFEQLCAIVVMGSLLYLMWKKGALTSAPLDYKKE